jgi:DNA primase
VIGFGGRAMRADQQPKYLNTAQSELFDKGTNLYALDLAKDAVRKLGQAIVVEGYMDALMAHQAGFTNVVATLGTAITERHVQVLRRQSAREIVLCLDNDAAGLRAALRGSGVAHDSTKDEAPRIDFSLLNRSERLRQREQPAIYIERRTVLKAFSLTGGKDPDEVIRHDPRQWERESAAAKPIIDFVFDNLRSVYDLSQTQGRREAATAAVGLVYDVADPIDRDQYLQRLAAIIGTDVDVLRELLRRRMHVVQRGDAAPSPAQGRPYTGFDGGNDGAISSDRSGSTQSAGPTTNPVAPTMRTDQQVGADERLQDLVISLLLRAGPGDAWPDELDFESTPHREILRALRAGPAWPDAATALDRLQHQFSDTFPDTLQRVQARDSENERISADELAREFDVRRLELRKHRLFRQHQALVAALREEGEGLDVAERQESHERLARLAVGIGETIAEQQRLGVIGTASWSIRRGQEVLGG